MRASRVAILGLVGSFAGGAGCGRSTVFECVIGIAPTSLDFGATPFGPVATTNGGSFAMKFWGGSFWIFIGDAVFQVPRNTGVATEVLSGDGYDIVGAGVSDCAPVQ